MPTWIKINALVAGLLLIINPVCGNAKSFFRSDALLNQILITNRHDGKIIVGWKSSAVIAFSTSDSGLQLKVIQIQRSFKDALPSVVVSEPLRYLRSMGTSRIYWTRNDDLIIVQPGFITTSSIGTLKSGASIIETRVSLRPFAPITWHSGDRPPPSQVTDSVLIPRSGSNQKVIKFNVLTGKIRITDAVIGPHHHFIWNGGDLLGRSRLVAMPQAPSFDIFDWKSGRWRKFNLPPSPFSMIPLLIRLNGKSDVEIIMYQPHQGAQPDRILAWRSGTGAFRTLAEGKMKRVVLSPSGDDVYGFFRRNDRFQVVADRQRSPKVNFWLARFTQIDGLIDFGIFDQGRSAIIKRKIEQRVRIAVFVQKNLSEIREIHLLAEGRKEASK